jgi:ParB family transcriptional regulator, chromosome partitioning protein
MVAKKHPKIAPKPTIPPAADAWINQGGLDPELTRETVARSSNPTIPPKPVPTKPSTLKITDINDRVNTDTRPLNQAHVEALAESIAAVGLIQPIAVDKQGRLLAGGHRKAAILHLRETNTEAFDQQFSAGVPIYRYEFDADAEPERALAIETSENEKRRDYTATEVKELAERLKAAGYHHTRGRAKAGAKSLLPSLAVIVGKSERQIKRYLADETTEDLNGTHVPFSQKYLKQAVQALTKYQNASPSTPKERKLLKEIPDIITRLEQAIDLR